MPVKTVGQIRLGESSESFEKVRETLWNRQDEAAHTQWQKWIQ